tara:strand:+ start:90 stop:1088 length:999 start_codon:yes stop_codon:yes gene_type:complete
MTASYCLPLAARSAITLATQTTTGAHSDGGFVEVDATNMPGVYRFDLPDAAVASGRSVVVYLHGATNQAQTVLEIELTANDNQDAVRGGMTALPNAAADAAGGLAISDAGGLNIDQIGTDTAATQALAVGTTGFAAIDTVVDSILADTGTDGVVIAAAQTVATVTTLTGHTAQTGDTYALANGATGFAAIDTVVDATQALAAGATGFAAIDTVVDAILVDTGTTIPGTITTIDTNVDAILVDTAVIGAAGAGLTALATQASVNTVDTVVDGIQTDLSNATDGLGAIKTDTAAVKVATDKLTFTVANKVDSNVKSVTDITVTGIGTTGDPWGP